MKDYYLYVFVTDYTAIKDHVKNSYAHYTVLKGLFYNEQIHHNNFLGY